MALVKAAYGDISHVKEHGTPDVAINYAGLKEICAIRGLGCPDSELIPGLAHAEFISRYKEMIKPSQPRGPSPKTLSSLSKRPAQCSRTSMSSTSRGDERAVRACQFSRTEEKHDIREYILAVSSRHRKQDDADLEKERLIHLATLRRLLRKKSVARTRENNQEIFESLKYICSGISEHCSDDDLKLLCTVARLDVWDEPNIAIDALNGLYVILHGSVETSNVLLHQMMRRGSLISPAQLTEGKDFQPYMLSVGDLFGTLLPVNDTETLPAKSVCSVVTKGPCELLVIASSDCERTKQKELKSRELEKLDILNGCRLTENWPKHPLGVVSKLIAWKVFPTGTVILKEGKVSDMIGIVKSGECRILRKIESRMSKPNTKSQDRRWQKVEMCRIGQFESFGEASLLFDDPMSYSVVASEPVEIAIIERQLLQQLDDVTLQLLRHSSETAARKFSQVEVEDAFVRQDNQRKWSQTKSQIMADSLYYSGIQPGTGKWSK